MKSSFIKVLLYEFFQDHKNINTVKSHIEKFV